MVHVNAKEFVWQDFLTKAPIRPTIMLCKEPLVFFTCIYLAFDIYGFNTGEEGLSYLFDSYTACSSSANGTPGPNWQFMSACSPICGSADIQSSWCRWSKQFRWFRCCGHGYHPFRILDLRERLLKKSKWAQELTYD
ncbi:uncharacterized protein K444DRAFT_627389 [Hyaloscypha bicolor E]|uniref:Uncharacterized protein n=1 Tax=Hyaloscypha bicolor E TaxID=1095630 RepID=A0A2J6THM2_9HELO|nr:uncharacterized protein K444DRAFT_627389 [Hyaloscypha bicolor E]PMD62458.1 hypothetical protein K444DRAFT_627389 [Hyaloscypha bicolor E]